MYCSTCNVTYEKDLPKDQHSCPTCQTRFLLECRNCGRRYKYRHGMILHLRSTCLPGNTTFSCNSCEFKAPLKYQVRQHIRNTHSDQICDEVMLEVCQKCAVAFPTYKMLKEHEVHCVNNDSHNCVFCSFKAPTPFQLKIHVQQMHPSSFDVTEKRFVYFSDHQNRPETSQPHEIDILPEIHNVDIVPQTQHVGMMPQSHHVGIMSQVQNVGMMHQTHNADPMPEDHDINIIPDIHEVKRENETLAVAGELFIFHFPA